jgi:hypothetical protein
MLDKRRNFSVLGSREEKTNNKKKENIPLENTGDWPLSCSRT